MSLPDDARAAGKTVADQMDRYHAGFLFACADEIEKLQAELATERAKAEAQVAAFGKL